MKILFFVFSLLVFLVFSSAVGAYWSPSHPNQDKGVRGWIVCGIFIGAMLGTSATLLFVSN